MALDPAAPNLALPRIMVAIQRCAIPPGQIRRKRGMHGEQRAYARKSRRAGGPSGTGLVEASLAAPANTRDNRLLPWLAALLLLVWTALPQTAAPRVLELRMEAPPDLAAVRARLAAIDPEPFSAIAALVGLDDPAGRIRVLLEPEDSPWAHSLPASVAGLAFAEDNLIVLFPNRSPVYPHDTLEDVLRHEVAHVLIGRASGGRDVPRWFHEGLAIAAERPWGLRDRTRLIAELAFGPRPDLATLDRLFAGDAADRTRAYSLAAALVRDMLVRYGRRMPGEVLARVARDVPFDVAFAEVAGQPLSVAEAAFWRDQRVWTTWVPLATSATTLWLLVTLLALLAMLILRARRASRRARWAEEEDADDTAGGTKLAKEDEHAKASPGPDGQIRT
jgi:hypothetical protein